MIDFERNLDAYRILAEILSDMREAVQKELESRYGSDWFRTGLPEGVLDRLIERKEKEKAIDWYESEYQQLIDFATFFDLLEVLEHDSELIPYLRALAPSAPLLHARMLELDVMRDKLSLARSISDNELVFLGTFHLRFRQALQHEKSTESEPAKGRGHAEAGASDVTDNQPTKTAVDEQKTHTEEPVDINVARARAKEARAASGGAAGSTKTTKPVPPPQPVKAASAGSQPEPEPQPESAPEPAIPPLSQAMDANEHREVLRALYREVTSIAEGLWGSDVPPSPSVWERVRVHPWYEGNFSALGLKPLSDFYDIASKVRERMSSGIARDELQDFLKEHSFANVLLALRDMFQKNGI